MQITINININDRIINFFKRLMTKKNAVAILSVSVIATTLFLYAAPIAKQFTFTDGSTASASDVNANFDDLFTKINELDTTVTGLQTGANPVYGNASGAGIDSVYVDASGNFGIGTTSPSFYDGMGVHIYNSATNFATLKLENPDGKWELLSGPLSGGFGIYDSNANGYRMFIDTFGNVGIGGTTTPNSKLAVVGLPSGTTRADAGASGNLEGAVCITDTGNMYIDTGGSCAD